MAMVFLNCCPKHPNNAFLVPNSRILIFARNFAIRQTEGGLILIMNMTIVFQHSDPKTQIELFLSPFLFFFVLDESL